MSVPILSCACGLRMKAKGATPGRVGRCPKCGRTLRVPGGDEPGYLEAVARGSGLQPEPASPVPPPVEARPRSERPQARKKAKKRPGDSPRKPVEVTREIEGWRRPDVLFPTRGAEGLMMVASLGLTSWVLAVLTPELGLAFLADGEKLGASLMGKLIALIVCLPGLLLAPLAIVYALQYYGRVLVSAAMGEVLPPRPPDRNFEGLFSGLGPWIVWLTCGATIGFAPIAWYIFSRGWDAPARPVVGFALASIGLPYALMSLLMAFLHEQGLPRPIAVIGTLLRLNFGFLAISAIVAFLGLIAWGAVAAVLLLREGHYWTYIVAMLAWCCLAQWIAIVAMRVLGVYYHHHGSILRWHREKPWWGVTWGV